MTTQEQQAQPTIDEMAAMAVAKARPVFEAHYLDTVEALNIYSTTFKGCTRDQLAMVRVPITLPVFYAIVVLACDHPVGREIREKVVAQLKAEAVAEAQAQVAANPGSVQ